MLGQADVEQDVPRVEVQGVQQAAHQPQAGVDAEDDSEAGDRQEHVPVVRRRGRPPWSLQRALQRYGAVPSAAVRVWVAFIVMLGVLSAPAAARVGPAPAERPPALGRMAASDVFEGPIGRAACGPGSLPETGLQGQVPRADRLGGRSAQGYRCNLERVGQWQGEGASWVSQSYAHCAYVSTRGTGTPFSASPGVQVLDVTDPAAPKRTANLATPGMVGTWETLKVSAGRGLLAGVFASAPGGNTGAFFDVYDLKGDCAHPKLVSSTLLPVFGHEGDFSPDGRTYWAAAAYESVLSAIDLADPAKPAVLWSGRTGVSNHGFGFSPDGRRLYLSEAGKLGSGALLQDVGDDLLSPNGLQVFDVSAIQDRRPSPQPTELGHVFWTDGAAGQHTIRVTYGGRPYVFSVDELLSGGVRLIDVADDAAPRVVSKLRLEIQLPQHADLRRADTSSPVLFGYDTHYCTVDRPTEPTTLACGAFASGVRVWDVRDPRAPVEVAYYNPPPAIGRNQVDLPGSEHPAATADMTTDWCSSPPRFVGDTLWVTCQDSGFQVLRFTNGAWPLPAGTPADLGLPSARACASRRRFAIRLPRSVRRATVRVNGRIVRTVRGARRLRSVVDLRGLPRGIVRVRVDGRTAAGRRVVQERTYRTCRAS